MDITKFTEEVDETAEYKYKMLIYGNYTFRDDLEKDSQVIVLKSIIPYLSARYNIHFTILIPEHVVSLDFPNVDQVMYKLPTYPNTMRTNFDAMGFLKIINWREKDFDIIYSHLPEHTAQIANCIYNNTHLRPKIIGYSHWFEVEENSPYEKTMLPSNFAGMLEMEECGVNSEWLKGLVLDKAEDYLSTSMVDKLETIIQPHYLGVEETRKRGKTKQKSVIFNHRDNEYTGWKWFCDAMDGVWKDRQDFTVYSTMARIDRPWNTHLVAPTRSDYLDRLSTMHFGIGAFQKYSAWSISVTDGLSVNVPYLLPNDFCYPEMVPEKYPYLYEGAAEFKQMFNTMLDTPQLLDMNKISNSLLWNSKLDKWFGGWDNVFALVGMKDDTPAFLQIIDYIKESNYISKKDLLDRLAWGIHIKWTGYRNRLRNVPEIKFTKHGYEWRNNV